MTAAAGIADARVPGYLGRVLDGGGAPVGTCFQVASGVLVTAWHVLDDIDAAADGALVRIDPLAGGEAFDATVARLDSQRDLAVLTSAVDLPTVAGPLSATDQVPRRATVTVTGHAVLDDPGHMYGFLDAPGEWAGKSTRDEVPLGRMTSNAVMPGMSGGPVICDNDGTIAGVVSGRYNSADGWLAGTVWVARTEDLAVLLDGIAGVTVKNRPLAGPIAGRPLAEVTDPFTLEVHQPMQPADPWPGLPVLPPYMPRDHDAALGSVVRAACEGRSGIAVLVGGSSTGKTRACWEALELLRNRPEPWRLWHPIDPTRPDAALRELPTVGPRTVVWLNEAQHYLITPASQLGERVAAGLRELLRDPARGPVLVLATLWPEHWDGLTAGPADGADPCAQPRWLLDGHDIPVPAAFTAAQVHQLSQVRDERLVQAAAEAQDGQVIQFLAGVPELLARYHHAPPAVKALIHAAMDARRLGMGIALPRAFLAAATPPPGYLTDTEWDAQDDDWLEQALASTARPAKGVQGPLTRIRPRPARSSATGSGAQDSDEQVAGDPASSPGGPLYRLADYLDQHGRVHRKGQFPPVGFWTAAAAYAFPADQAALGDAAHARGLYRDAAQLHKNAAARGNPHAVSYLSNIPAYFRGDDSPALWATAHTRVDDPRLVAVLLGRLLQAGAQEHVTALAGRAAAHVPVDDPSAVAALLDTMARAGAHEQVSVLARRAAAHVPVDPRSMARMSDSDPRPVAGLLDSMREVGAHEQVTALARRAAAQVSLDDTAVVAWWLFMPSPHVLPAFAPEQVTALLRRDPAAHVALDDPAAVARLLDGLRDAGAPEQVTTLLHRGPAAHVALDDPAAVAALMDSLRDAGAPEQVTALLCRDPAAHVALDDPAAVARLLDGLREAGAPEQVTTLLRRDPAAHVSLDDPAAVARLLDRLQEAGAPEQVTVLTGRAAAQVAVDDPAAVAALLEGLRKAGAPEQVTVLTGRAAAQVSLDDPAAVAAVLDRLREAGAPEQVTALLRRDPAAHVALDDPAAVARLLDGLREAGAPEQVTTLLRRDPAAHASLDKPFFVAQLLARLRQAGAQEQVTVLAKRAAAHVPVDSALSVLILRRELLQAGAHEQVTVLAGRAAAHLPLDDPAKVAVLLDSLRWAGAHEQVATLLRRNPAARVHLEDPAGVARLLDSLREAEAPEQVAALLRRDPAARVLLAGLGYRVAVAELLDCMRRAGAPEQAAALVGRLPREGTFGLFRAQEDHQDRFLFGREADGSPAKPWDWGDLD